MKPYDLIGLVHLRSRYYLATWRHRAITWTTVDISYHGWCHVSFLSERISQIKCSRQESTKYVWKPRICYFYIPLGLLSWLIDLKNHLLKPCFQVPETKWNKGGKCQLKKTTIFNSCSMSTDTRSHGMKHATYLPPTGVGSKPTGRLHEILISMSCFIMELWYTVSLYGFMINWHVYIISANDDTHIWKVYHSHSAKWLFHHPLSQIR